MAKNTISAIKSAFDDITGKETYGICHTAISIGSCLIEWNNSGMVNIRPIASAKAVLSTDAKYKGRSKIILLGKELDNLLDKVAEEIVKWNGVVYYNEYADYSSTENVGNCQTFTNALLSIMRVPANFSPLISMYICASNNIS